MTLEGAFGVQIQPGSRTLGLTALTLSAQITCGSAPFSYGWIDETHSAILGTEATLLIEPSLAESTAIRLEILDANQGLSSDQILILVHPGGLDLNGDQINSIEDLYLTLPTWTTGTSGYEADGDGKITILDLLFINTGSP